jgi:hypothetical protein
MPGAPIKEETVLIRMQVSVKLYAYLRSLRRRSILGASENDIAKFLLTQRLEQMIAEKYHEKQAPPDEPT